MQEASVLAKAVYQSRKVNTMASHSDRQEKGGQSALLRIMNELEIKAQCRHDLLQAAKQQYELLHGKMETFKKIYPKKFEAIRKIVKQLNVDLRKLDEKQRKFCPALVQMMEIAVESKLDVDGKGRRELMLLNNIYSQSTELKVDKKGTETAAPKPRGVDPNVIRFDPLYKILYQKEFWSKHGINSQSMEQAQAEFQSLKIQWGLILDKNEEKVRKYLNDRERKHKSLADLPPPRTDKPLHKLMERLSHSNYGEKEEILREYIQLVAVCTIFKGDIDSSHPSKQVPDEGSSVDPRSHLERVLQRYFEAEDVSEDIKDTVREEHLNLTRLGKKYGPRQDIKQTKTKKTGGKHLKDIVSKEQRKTAENVYTALQYAETGHWEHWREAAVEFCQLADVFSKLKKSPENVEKALCEDQGARPKAAGAYVKYPLHDFIMKNSQAEKRQFALQQYESLTAKAAKLPRMREEENLAQSVSRLNNPGDLPDDPDSPSYNILQILKASDPKMDKNPAAWDEYFFLLAEEQRFIQIKNTQDVHQEQATMVQAPCQRQPQRNMQEESYVRLPHGEWQQLMQELNQKTQEVEELTTRLSRFASQQLTSGNPNIADLSDRNRPTKIGEMFGQLYDNEWSEAFDALKDASESLKDSVKKGTSMKKKSQKGLARSTKKDHQDQKDSNAESKTGSVKDSKSPGDPSVIRPDKQNDSADLRDVTSDNTAKSDHTDRAKADTSGKTEVENEGEGHDKVTVVTEHHTEQKEVVDTDDTLVAGGGGMDGEVGAMFSGERSRVEPKVGPGEGQEQEEDEEEEEDFHVEELTILQGIVMAAYEFCKDLAASQREIFEQDMINAILLKFMHNTKDGKGDVHRDQTEEALCKEFKSFTTKQTKDFSKLVGPMSCKVAAKKFEEEKLSSLTKHCATDPAIVEYANKCIELTWFMAIQDPPMKLLCLPEGSKFKLSEFAYHGRKGKAVELCVWPALFLHENGPLVNKGHVLPKLVQEG